ncbi:MAG: hypothetical protein HKN23_14605 [Verrucomicrobiales bacterium]|nr:hypothetical protein [Verrucomicrobiales bacterium]
MRFQKNREDESTGLVRRINRVGSFFGLIGLLAAPAFSAEPYPCRQTETPIRLDGKADDPAWRHAAEIPNFVMPWVKEGDTEATTSTKAKLLWDAKYLYYFAEMEDGDLRATRKERDGELWLDDVFELFFKPSPDQTGYYELQATPLGTLLDIYYPDREPGQYDTYKNKDRFGHAVKVVVNGTLNDDKADTGWQVEGRIPWTDFKPTGGAPKIGDEWKFTLCRYDYDSRFENKQQAELSVSEDTMVIRDFHKHENYGTLKFEGVFDPKTALPADLQKIGGLDTNLVGSPDPPLPYRAQRALEHIPISRLIDFQFEPDTKRMLFIDQPPGTKGSRLVRLLDRKTGETEVLMQSPENTFYSIEFHPKFAENGRFYLSAFGQMSSAREQRRVQIREYRMTRDKAATVYPETMKVIIEWDTWGHTGGAMAFDDDGYFYVTSGDGTGDSDTRLTGQNLSVLHAKVLRLDIENPDEGRNYSVPPDNPFLDLENARPETFAYGMRNPWRMVWDKKLKRLWVGNNGQDLLEQVYLIERGGNYGWSVMEGSGVFYAERPRGPHPFLPPTFEHDHGVSRSLTGGMVYEGDVLPELKGAYIYGDHSTGKIWAGRHDGEKVTWNEEIADTTLGISQFNNDPVTGDLLVSHHGNPNDGGGLYRLVPNPPDPDAKPFPKKLSQTGLFKNVADHEVRDEALPYKVIVPQWADGAEIDRFVTVPTDNPTIPFGGNRGWNFPDGSVAFQTLSLGGKRLETRVMTKQDKEWVGYSYAWNDAQTDAELVPTEGGEIALNDGKTWKIPSRIDCMNCHSRAANFILGLETAQMNLDVDYGDGFVKNQLAVMDDLGLFLRHGAAKRTSTMRGTPETNSRLVDPFDETNPDIDARARSFLHARCSGCHREAGGGNAMMHLQHFQGPEKFGVINAEPNHGNQGLEGDDVRIVKPGDPSKSVMFIRCSKTGPGKMPPVGPESPDPKVVPLLLEWILQAKEEPPAESGD